MTKLSDDGSATCELTLSHTHVPCLLPASSVRDQALVEFSISVLAVVATDVLACAGCSCSLSLLSIPAPDHLINPLPLCP